MVASNDAAKDLWPQIFDRLAAEPAAAVWEPEGDTGSEDRLRRGLKSANWSDEEIGHILLAHERRLLDVSPPPVGISPYVHAQYEKLCGAVEDAMQQLGLHSHEAVARGVEPRIGPYAAKTAVVMTDESIVSVGAHLFRFCGLIARAYTRTLLLHPWLWEHPGFSEADGIEVLRNSPETLSYWHQIYLSYAATGTNISVPFKPSRKSEVLLMEQVARAMELFAISHEYGHHHHGHGRAIASADPHQEEFEADQFALRVCREVERRPLFFENPYLLSGAGGAILLLAIATLRKMEDCIDPTRVLDRATHPPPHQRIARFDAVALLEPAEFKRLKGFRAAGTRILETVDAMLVSAWSSYDFSSIRNLCAWKFDQ